jgi:hypothetical protein
MVLNDFNYIKQKIRNVTARPSANQLTDQELTDYINSFLVYDLPLHCRFFIEKQKFAMNLVPNVGTYSITTFKNTYSNFEPPCYVDGYQIQYYQSDESFYQMFSQLKYSAIFTNSSGIAGPYNGFYSYTPIQPTTVIISTTDVLGNLLTATDVQLTATTGQFVDQTGVVIAGSAINYTNGVITGITFTAPPPVGNLINISANQYLRGRPLAMLYFHDTFTFWPFPDKSYQFTIDAYINPIATVLGGGALFPELNQWADVIAFGASLKIFQDNLDFENYQKTMPFFDNAKRLALRRTMKQLSTQRVATIYGDAEVWPWQSGYPFI